MSLANLEGSPLKFLRINTPKQSLIRVESEKYLYQNMPSSPLETGIFDKTEIKSLKSLSRFPSGRESRFLPSINPIKSSVHLRDLNDRKSTDMRHNLKKVSMEDKQFMQFFKQKFQKSMNLEDALNFSHDSDYFIQKDMLSPDPDDDIFDTKNSNKFVRDNKKKNTVGQFTQVKFFEHQKQIEKIKQENEMFKVSDSLYTKLIKSQESVNLLPKKLGIIKQKGKESTIQLNLGDKYAKAFAEGIKCEDIKDKIKKIDLMNNNLTDKGMQLILNSLNSTTEELNLSQNSVGSESINQLIMILRNYQNALSKLNLDNTRLSDQNSIRLLEALKKLRILDLSNNKLTDECSVALANSISTRCPLVELYLHWNRLTGIAGERIAKALYDNQSIRVLDLSNNSIGLQNSDNCAKAFSKLFEDGESDLIHVDLSNNNWTKNQIVIISQGLNLNQTIYGFHIDSKYSSIDSFGFLNVVESEMDLLNKFTAEQRGSQIVENNSDHHKRVMSLNMLDDYTNSFQRIHGLVPLPVTQKSLLNESMKQNICWICQGWSEQTFIWKSGESGLSYSGPIYLHANFDEYKPVPMIKDEFEGQFYLKRMCPPSQNLLYFFSTPDGDTHAKDQPCLKNKNPLLKDIAFGTELKRDITIKFLNCKSVSRFEGSLFSKYGEPIHTSVQPRQELDFPQDKPKPKKKWTKETSVFGKYQQDNSIILEKAMDADWNNSKIPRFVKDVNDRTKLFELIKPHYEGIKALYKYYSSFSPIGDVWAISKLLFTEIFTKSGLVDNKTLKLADLEIKFIASKTLHKKSRGMIPERGMVRHEFLEGIIRIAEEKYMINGDCTSYTEAVRQILNDGFLKVISEVENPAQWRDERYWNQECDFCYKYYMQILMTIFENYENTIRTCLPNSKFLNLDEFKKMFSETNILSDQYANERFINIAFNFSVQTQIDEIYDERILQLHFIEFLEALARAAEKFSLPPYKKLQNILDTSKEEDLNWEQRQLQPLHKKIENLIRLIFYQALPPEKSEQFELNDQSIFEQKDLNETMTAPIRQKAKATAISSDQQKPNQLQKVTELLKKTLKLTKIKQ